MKKAVYLAVLLVGCGGNVEEKKQSEANEQLKLFKADAIKAVNFYQKMLKSGADRFDIEVLAEHARKAMRFSKLTRETSPVFDRLDILEKNAGRLKNYVITNNQVAAASERRSMSITIQEIQDILHVMDDLK